MSNTNEVVFNRRFLCKNSEFKVTYTGKLYKNNSDTVFIKYGYGKEWNHMKEQQMLLNSKGFCAKIIPEYEGDLNFCFRNSNNEYDNNNYQNYTASIGKEVNSQAIVDIDALIDEILSSVNTTPVEFEVTPSTQDVSSDLKFEVVEASTEILPDDLTQISIDTASQPDTKSNNSSDIMSNDLSVSDTKSNDLYVEDVLVPYYLADNEQVATELSDEEQKDFLNTINTIVKTESNEKFVSESYISENSKTYENKIEDYNFVTDSFIPDSTDVLEPIINSSPIKDNNTSLLEYKISSPRKLSKFYFFKKKVRLALYRLLVTIPKLLSGNFGKNSNN